jgi:hypothetical protein
MGAIYTAFSRMQCWGGRWLAGGRVGVDVGVPLWPVKSFASDFDLTALICL